MTAHCKPFAFGALNSEEPAAKSYTQLELDQACVIARDLAIASEKAEAARRSAQVLNQIELKLVDAIQQASNQLHEERAALTELACAVIKRFCAKADSIYLAENAVSLLNQFLSADGDSSNASLQLPEGTDTEIVDGITGAVSKRCSTIKVETSADLLDGDIRIIWRGGDMVRRRSDINAQIQEIFSAHKYQMENRL